MVLWRTAQVSCGSKMYLLRPVVDPLNEHVHVGESLQVIQLKFEKAGVVERESPLDRTHLNLMPRTTSCKVSTSRPTTLSISSPLKSHHSASGFTHPSKQYLFCTYYMPGPVLSVGQQWGTQIDTDPRTGK